jgi:hypothetical protein
VVRPVHMSLNSCALTVTTHTATTIARTRTHACSQRSTVSTTPQTHAQLAAIEYRDIRLRPKLNKLCSEERAVYCKDTQPGVDQVWNEVWGV